jgi:hypothetical protein
MVCGMEAAWQLVLVFVPGSKWCVGSVDLSLSYGHSGVLCKPVKPLVTYIGAQIMLACHHYGRLAAVGAVHTCVPL